MLHSLDVPNYFQVALILKLVFADLKEGEFYLNQYHPTFICLIVRYFDSSIQRDFISCSAKVEMSSFEKKEGFGEDDEYKRSAQVKPYRIDSE